MTPAFLPKQIRGSFGAKLLLVMVLLIAALSMLFSLLLHYQHRSSHHQHVANTGSSLANILAKSIVVEVFAEDTAGLETPVAAVVSQENVLGVAIFNSQKELLYSQGEKEFTVKGRGWNQVLGNINSFPCPSSCPKFVETEEALLLYYPISYSLSSGSEDELYFGNAEQDPNIENIGYIALALSAKSDVETIRHVFFQALFSTVVFFLLGVVLTYFVVRRLTYPLSSLLEKVRSSTDGQDRSDDLDLLSKTFDAQVNELRDTFTTINSLKKELEIKNRELAADIDRRKKLEATLRKRENILSAVNNAAEKLLGESTEWVHYIEAMVDQIGEVLEVGAIRVLKHHIDTSGDAAVDLKHEWIDEDVKATVDNLDRQNLAYKKLGFGSWLDPLQKGEIVSGNSADMPPAVKSWHGDHHIKSIALAPIMVDKDCWGAISLAMFYREQKWSDPELDALQAVARLIGAAIHRDKIMTDLVTKQSQLAHAGRLTAMGEMASGMAHEINQPLTVINLGADACTTYFNRNSPEAPEAEAAKDISVQVGKIARIVENMRIFSRQSTEEMAAVNLADPVQAALAFFRLQFREHGVELIEEIAENAPKVKTDSQKFEQIAVNFLSNARYAVDKRGETELNFRKKIAVRLYMDSLSRSRLKFSGLKEKDFSGEQVTIFEVEDNGIGMDEDVKKRCLEPFYTMKEVGEGTGLGLSVSHSIIKELGFGLDIESRENIGSTFRVIVPLHQDGHYE